MFKCACLKEKNDRSRWKFIYCLRTELTEGRIQRATYIFDGFLYMVTAIGILIYSVA